ncbi:MAG: chemotaxis protein CheW [Anaerolineae bacterium]|nr:chemotaxis protein CheW [Anaerolineae bacterium]MDW8172221.1 chemotaxis protein CheW [Anaerolineae bacterium]
MNAERSALLLLRVDQARYGLPIAEVREVGAMQAMEKVVGAPPYLLGLLNRHGQPLPLLDLRRILGAQPPPPRLDDLFVVVQREDSLLALLVDEVLGVVTMDAADFRPLVNSGPFVRQVASDGHELLQILDLETVWTAYAPSSKASLTL